MILDPLPLSGAFRVALERRKDARGFLARLFCVEELADAGIDFVPRQVNLSFTRGSGGLRGLHFQRAPRTDAKLVHCVRGAIHDVIVDIRQDSPTFGHHVSVELNEENRGLVFVPRGFAHGFQTLRPDTELLYLHSAPYSPEHDAGLAHDDPALGIAWPLPVGEISARDRNQPRLAEIDPWAP